MAGRRVSLCDMRSSSWQKPRTWFPSGRTDPLAKLLAYWSGTSFGWTSSWTPTWRKSTYSCDTYRDRPIDLADACLVRMSEIHPNSTVVTTDSDFHVYRRLGSQLIPTITP